MVKKAFFILLLQSLSLISFAQLSAKKYLTLAREDIRNEQYHDAIIKLTFALKTQPNSASAYFYRALSKYKLSDHKGAIEDYTQCILRNPDLPGAYQNRGLARTLSGDHQGAIDDFNQSLKLDPSNYDVMLNKANSQIKMLDYGAAVSTLNQAIKQYPKEKDAYNVRGTAYVQLKKYYQAIEDFTTSIELDANDTETWLRRAEARLNTLDQKGALADCDSAIAIDSNQSIAYFIKGNIYGDQLNYTNAEKMYSKVIDLNPNNSLVYFNRGLVRSRLNKLDNAIYDYNRVIEINPKNIKAYYNLGICYNKKQAFKKSEASFTKIIELYPKYEKAWFNRAFARRELGNEKGAQEDFAQGNRIRSANQFLTYSSQEEVLLKEVTELSSDFKRPNFDAEESQIIISTFPFFEIKSVQYQSVSNQHLQYHTGLVNQFNEDHQNMPYFYLSNYQLNAIETPVDQQKKELSSLLQETDEKDERYYLWKATIHKQDFNFNQALLTYDSLIGTYPNSVLGYFNKANTQLDLLELLLKLEDGAGQFIDIGAVQEQQGLKDVETINLKLQSIESLYEKALQINPKFYYAWYNLAIVRAEQRNFKGAIKAYTQAIKLKTDFKEAYLNRGLTYLFLKQQKQACLDLQQAANYGLSNGPLIYNKYCD